MAECSRLPAAIPRRRRVVQCACILWLAAALSAQAEKVTIAATVNDEVITSSDVDARRDFVMTTANIPPTEENRQRITPRILQTLIDEALQRQEAKRQSITVSDEEISKTIDSLGERQHLPPGGLRKMLAEKGIELRTLENQLRAQLAWNKVVQRKLRRNVTISQDEIQRAQQAEATAPGVTEYHIAALLVPILPTSTESETKARIEEVQSALASGTAFSKVAASYAGRKDIIFNPPVWVVEEVMPPEVRKVMAELAPEGVTPPVRTGNVVQFIQLIEKRTTKKPPAATQVILKQITLAIPPEADKKMQARLAESAQMLRKAPGSCESPDLPTTPVPAKAEFTRVAIGDLTPDQQSAIARLAVGEVTEPLLGPDSLRLVLLCERQEPPATAGADTNTDALRQKIFEEKIELEAQKHLRNLRRDATIDVREP